MQDRTKSEAKSEDPNDDLSAFDDPRLEDIG